MVTQTFADRADAPPLAQLRPMLLVEEREARADPGCLAEIKSDGYRLLAEASLERVQLRTRGRDPVRGGVDATRWYPEVVAGLTGLARARTVLDGEVCVLDEHGHSDFERLHARSLRRRWYAGADPVVYVVFDVLVHQGRDVRALPLEERRALLQALLAAPRPNLLLSQTLPGEAAPWLFAQVVERRLEGIVMKRLGSAYVGGEPRTGDWIKIKRRGATRGFKRDARQ